MGIEQSRRFCVQILLHDLSGARRRVRRERLLSGGHSDDQRIDLPAAKNASKRTQHDRPVRDGYDGEQDQPEVGAERAVVDIREGQAAFPRADDLVVEQVRVGAAVENIAFIGEDYRGEITSMPGSDRRIARSSVA